MGDQPIEPPRLPDGAAPTTSDVITAPPPPPPAIGATERRFDGPLVLAGRLVLASSVVELVLVGWFVAMATRYSAFLDGRLTLAETERWESWSFAVTMLSFVPLIAAGIATSVALLRVHDAASSFARIDFGRWRVVWGWFVPIAALFVPYKVMRRFFDVTREPSVSLGWWWALMIVSTQLGRFVFQTESLVTSQVLAAINAAVFGVAGLMFARLLADLREGLHSQLDRRMPQDPTITS